MAEGEGGGGLVAGLLAFLLACSAHPLASVAEPAFDSWRALALVLAPTLMPSQAPGPTPTLTLTRPLTLTLTTTTLTPRLTRRDLVASLTMTAADLRCATQAA